MQDLPVRRIGRDFYVLQGKKPQEYLLYCKVFLTPQGVKRPAKAACREILNRL